MAGFNFGGLMPEIDPAELEALLRQFGIGTQGSAQAGPGMSIGAMPGGLVQPPPAAPPAPNDGYAPQTGFVPASQNDPGTVNATQPRPAQGPPAPAPTIPAAAPRSAPASAPAMPARGFLDKLGDLGGAMASTDPNLGKFAQYADASQSQNLTLQALLAKGVDPVTAQAAVRNPALLQQALSQAFPGPIKLGPGESLFRKDGSLLVTNGDNKPTNEWSNYQQVAAQYRAEGKPVPSFQQYQEGLKKAGALVMTDGQNSFQREGGQLQAKRFARIVDQNEKAQETISNMKVLADLQTQFEPGVWAEVKSRLGPWADAFGVKLEGLDHIQAYKALTSKLAPNMRVQGSGSSSDTDVRMFFESLPALRNTPGGNEVIQNMFTSIAEHQAKAAEIASLALGGEITASEANKMLRELPDPYDAWRKQTGVSVTNAQTSKAVPAPTAPPGQMLPAGRNEEGKRVFYFQPKKGQ